MTNESIVKKLSLNRYLSAAELLALLETDIFDEELFREADRVRRSVYGNDVYIRGLIEFTNYCKNNCFYCGIRCSNSLADRYRLSKDEILSCCREGYALGFRTFVLQGGEDPFFSDEIICDIVGCVHAELPDCAITLSIGEKDRESYQKYFDAGATRYLLRHETADKEHYSKLHPENLSLDRRKKCLFDLKEIGYQVGSGFMVGSPYQTTENIIADLHFLQQLQPDMIGIGPFIHHNQTPFAEFPNGRLELTLRIIAVLRLLFPHALIPSTTALGSLAENGRELGLRAGANVIMPNLSPESVREKYSLYENKLHSGAEAAQSLELLKKRVEECGYRVTVDIGNVKV